MEKKVVENILENSDLVPLPSKDYHISIQPFYQNFHKYIEQRKRNKGFATAAVNNDDLVKEDEETEVAKMVDDGEEVSEIEDDMEDEDVSEAGNEVKRKKKFKSFKGDETDNSEESNTEEEDTTTEEEDTSTEEEATNTKSVKNQTSVKEREKDTLSSKKGSLSYMSGFRGRDRGRMKSGLMETSRRGSFAKKSERNKVNAGMSNRMSTLHGKQNLPNEDGELESSHERQRLERDNMRGGKRVKSDLKENHKSLNSGDQSSNEESFIKRGSKQHNYKGLGGNPFVPGGARGIHSPILVSDRNMSENHGHGDHFPESFTKNLYTSKSDRNKECRTKLESIRSYGQMPVDVNHRVPENIINAGQSLPEKNTVSQKTQLEKKERYENEIAEKDAKIKQLEEELAKKKEQLKVCNAKVTVKMTAWQKEFLTDCFGSFTDFSVQFDPHENVATLDGTVDSIKDHLLKLFMELNKLKEKVLTLTPAMLFILSKKQGKQYLDKLNSSQLKGAKTFLQDENLLVAAKDDESLNFAMDFLKNRFNHKEIMKLNTKVPNEKLESERSMLEKKFLVKISWFDNDQEICIPGEICIQGIKDDVFESKRQIVAVIEEFGFHLKSFDVSGSLAKFFHKNLEGEIKQYLQDVEIIDYTFTEAQISIKFKGHRKIVNQIHIKLTALQTKVTTKSWNLMSEFKNPEDVMLITQGFSGEKLKRKKDSFETKNKCIIITKLPSLTFTEGSSKKSQPHHSSHVLKGRQQFKSAAAIQGETKLKFIMTDTCHLIVKPYGDIIKESSDVLVSVLTHNVDMRKTRVGQTFNRACPSLWKVLQAEHDEHPDDSVLTTKGPFNHLKSRAICHIIFNPWDPNVSPTELSKSIQSVISQAVALGAKSVSFPVLGCGKAFGFPPSDVAQITLSSLKSSNFGNTLQNVVLLAPDTELFKELTKEAPKHFQAAVPVTAKGAVGGASPDETIPGNTDTDDGSDESDESEDDEHVFEIRSHDLQESVNAEISIVALHDSGIEALWASLKKEITKICLYTEYFNQEISDFWPKRSREIISQEAKKRCVWVKRSPNPKTKKPGYIVKGAKQDVEAVLITIRTEFNEFLSHLPKLRIKSDKTPKRGTKEFLKHAASSDEIFPSYWKLNSSNNYIKLMWGRFKATVKPSKSEENTFLVDINTKTKDAIKNLVAKTWDPHMVGNGYDAQGLSHGGIKVTDVKRIENLNLFEQYSLQRQLLFKRMCEETDVCPDIGTLEGSKGRIVTTEHLEDFMKEELYYEINEHYLFHGTKSPDAICSSGIDPRVSSEGCMFGRGIYTAERFTKADQYTDPNGKRSPPGTQLTIILARVLLGNVFLCDDKHKSVIAKNSVKLTRPPCLSCLEDKCNCSEQKLFDSVMGNGKWLFREFVVYDKNHCYPEYLIYYQRV